MRHPASSACRAVALAASLYLAVPLTPSSVGAQADVPKRPALPPAADTNSADAYYDAGVRLLERDPRKAADAFYWATRMAPNRADAFYGRRSALLMADRSRFDRYMAGDRRTIQHPRTMQIDSLMVRALMIDPFLYRKFERLMFNRWIVNLNSTGAADMQPTEADVESAIQRWVIQGEPEFKGWAAYCSGDYRTALAEYGRAMKSTKRKARLRTERARIFYMSGRADSALVEFGLALEELRAREGKETVFLYDSKALMEHSVARAHEAAGRMNEAKEAYGRALIEDIAFHPAHVGLGLLAAQAGDSTTMESEMELAVQLQPAEPVVRLMYGSANLALGRLDAARAQLEKAIEIEPYFAAPYRLLAQVHEKRGDRAAALQRYDEFLARASATDPARAEATARHGALKAGGT